MLYSYLKRNICLSLLCVPSLLAQAVSGSIAGTVIDASGGIIPGAGVTVREVSRGLSAKAVTNESGNYMLAQLPPGLYQVHR
jgi:hypothetical protein